MDTIVVSKVLEGMPIVDFLILFAWASAGALLSYWRTADKARRDDPTTSKKWSWPLFFRGAKRMVTTLVGTAFTIIYWPEISSVFFNSAALIELTGFSAFLYVGVVNDKVTEAVFGTGKEAVKYIKKK